MALYGDTYLDLVDVYQRQPAKQGMIPFINMLSYAQPVLQDAIVMACNKGSENVTSLLTGLPTGSWGALYQGVAKSKSNRIQVTDTTGFYESMAGVDTRLADYSNNLQQLRHEEALTHIESMSQEMTSRIWYANSAVNPEQFTGFAPRFNSLSDVQSSQIVNGNGVAVAGSTSIWFITWGNTQSSLLYPANSMAGLKRTDHGKNIVQDANGNDYFQFMESFKWDMGVSVRDWRYVVRIANIDIAGLQAGTVDVYDLLQKAYYKHFGRFKKMGNTFIYCNTEVKQALDNQAVNKGGGDKYIRLRPGKDIQGEEVDMYRGYAVRECPSILNTEGLVT